MKLNNRNNHVALEITETAKNNRFTDTTVHGNIKLAGENNSFIRTTIFSIKREHPLLFWLGVVASIIGIVTGLIFLVQLFSASPS